MPLLKQHLRVALSHLRLEYKELDQALDHAISQDYGDPWVKALDKAVNTNLEATRHIRNILTTIGQPTQASYNQMLDLWIG